MTQQPDEFILLTPTEVRSLITTGISLGHTAATMGITEQRAKDDATTGPELPRLLDGLRHASTIRRAIPEDPTP